jgi:hypothetical protein
MITVGEDQWQMIEYEIKMFYATYKKLFTLSAYDRLPYVLKNALEESAVLHTRILCDVFLNRRSRRWEDDILLGDLLPGWPNRAEYGKMKSMQDKLKVEYEKSNDSASPCWQFNKMLAHPTSHRGREYDYRDILATLHPLIHDIIRELESLTGRLFRHQFVGPTHPPTRFWA